MKPLKLKLAKGKDVTKNMKMLKRDGITNILGFDHLWVYPLSVQNKKGNAEVLVSYDKGRTLRFEYLADIEYSILFYVGGK